MGSSWSYDELTQTVSVHPNFNSRLIGLPPDTKTIIFKEKLYNVRSQFNRPIKKNQLPPNGYYIKFGYSFNQPIEKDSLPNSLTHLTFGDCFNQPISQDTLPNSITHLMFGYNFNQPIKQYSLPNSLTHLIFGDRFNQPINQGVLPNSLIHLTFGFYFNQSISQDTLPANLTHLSISNRGYNKKLNNLPYGVKTVVIPTSYPIANIKIPFGCKVIQYHGIFVGHGLGK